VSTLQRSWFAVVIAFVVIACSPGPGPVVPPSIGVTPGRVSLSEAVTSREVRVSYVGPASSSLVVSGLVGDDRFTVSPTSAAITAGSEATFTISVDPDAVEDLPSGAVTFSAVGVSDVVVEVVVTAAVAGCTIQPGQPLPTAASFTAPHDASAGTRIGHVPGQLLVTYREAASPSASDAPARLQFAADVAASVGAVPLRVDRSGAHDLLLVPIGEEDVTAARLLADARVAHVSLNYLAHRLALPDASYDEQWYLWDFGLEEAWQVEDGGGAGAPIVIAIVDDGVNVAHVDLAGKALPGRDIYCGDDDVRTFSLHGTHVAGVAVAGSDPDGLVVGVAKGERARLLPVKVFPDDPALGGTLDAVVRGIRWAAQLPVDGESPSTVAADVINLSLGFGTSLSEGAVAILQDAVDDARARGSVLVAASGNEGGSDGVVYPARLDGVLAVGSVDWEFTRSSFSTYGEGLDLMAPGGTAPADEVGGGSCSAAGRVSMIGASLPDPTDLSCQSGTSMAAAFVSGTAALLIARDEATYRGDPAAIEARLLETALQPDEYTPAQYGAGLVCPDAVFGLGTACTLPPGSFGP
jgi:serine protease